MKKIEKSDLKVGMIIYEKQPRWFDNDYHPQEITSINDKTIDVFEKGYFPNGKAFEIEIKHLQFEKNSGEVIIVH